MILARRFSMGGYRAVAYLVGLVCLLSAVACMAEHVTPEPQSTVPKMLRIEWERYPNLPQGFQDSDGGFIGSRLITVGGFCQGFDDARKPGHYPRGFLSKVWALDASKPSGRWQALPDFPGAARQGLSCIPVGDSLYCWGGFNYTEPYCYTDGYRLTLSDDRWNWSQLPSLPWPMGMFGICSIGSKVYAFGGADYDYHKFTTDTDRTGKIDRMGARLLVFDTAKPGEGWKRLPDCPGTPRCVAAMAAVGGKVYVIGGASMPASGEYLSVVDNWVFDPADGTWRRLRDLPVSSGNFPDGSIVYKGRYIILVGGFQYERVMGPDGVPRPRYGHATQVDGQGVYFRDVFVYDTRTDLFGTADPLPINNNMPMAVVRGDEVFVLGGEADAREIDGEYYGHHPDLCLRGKIEELTMPTPDTPTTVDIGTRVEMFVNDWLIDGMRGACLQLRTPVKREVVMSFDKPWEGSQSAYVTVLRDGDKVRMYYRGRCQASDFDPGQVTCCAESTDGVHFTRPNLGLVEFGGSKDNNIILRGVLAHNFSPFLDTNPACKPEERYKAVAGLGGEGGGLFGLVSADGIHWRKVREGPLTTAGDFDSLNLAFWDTNTGCYRLYSRYFADGVRAIQSATSPDFINWSAQQPNVYGIGVPMEHFYTNATVLCPGAEHTYLSFPMRFVPQRKKMPEHPATGVSDAVFMSSRDGVHWDRTFREAWVRPGPDPLNWTDRNTMPATGIIETGPDEFSMYVSEHYRHDDARLTRVTIRRHGFASVHAGADGGEFVTRPLTFSGKRLIINYATSAVGSVQVEIQDADGKPMQGFALADTEPLFGDEVDAAVTWKGGSDLSSLIGKAVRLRFVLKDADLFSLRTSAL